MSLTRSAFLQVPMRQICLSFLECAYWFFAISLRGRRLKGKGKEVLGARETRGARSLLARLSRFPPAPNPLSLPFQTPATQATSRFATQFQKFKIDFAQKRMANKFHPSIKQHLRHILGFHLYQTITTWLEALLINWSKSDLMFQGKFHCIKTIKFRN